MRFSVGSSFSSKHYDEFKLVFRIFMYHQIDLYVGYRNRLNSYILRVTVTEKKNRHFEFSSTSTSYFINYIFNIRKLTKLTKLKVLRFKNLWTKNFIYIQRWLEKYTCMIIWRYYGTNSIYRPPFFSIIFF